MVNTHELLCLTVTTLADGDAWASVQDVTSKLSPEDLRWALEEVLIVAAGLAVQASTGLELDVMNLIDDNYEILGHHLDN